MRDVIVNLIGASGSGKTTVAKELEKEGYNIIKSYTTREPREPDEWGHTFIEKPIFKDDTEKVKFKFDDNKIAYFEGYGDYYFATKDQYRGKGTSIYVVDPDGAEQVKRNVEDAKVMTILLVADTNVKTKRMVLDKRIEKSIYDRLRKDEEIFSKCKCDYAVDSNRGLEYVVADIKNIINGSDYY